MSKSIYWNFLQCEDAALAELNGEYRRFQDETPLLVGNYLHSFFESEESHQQFLDDHKKEIFKYGNPEKGMKKAFVDADKMINTLKDDPYFDAIYQGDKEVIVAGTIDGIKWKGKLDCLVLDRGLFLDLKTTQDLHKKYWNAQEHTYQNFAEIHGYILQMAIYQELVKQQFGKKIAPFIIAVSKQDIPDKGIYSIPQELMDDEMNKLIKKQDHIKNVIDGKEKPEACGRCAWCRSKKELTNIIPIDWLKIG
ncbi:hypothetical protein FC87_GL000324 [Fructilactobacillus florum DSM 22689 = JCM 16035]|uniref:Putative exodeoxyribonuclease 8 PDDEXK-like domain-containing protein n=2 Tax=Fructilactobacillus florum TaxID=640331 RepID=A0A0R2CEX1_9LACO|nr:hypothetical protein FC87_GL000324 [Fructilactobacillus florum DSM 22689 = JCM 16035]